MRLTTAQKQTLYDDGILKLPGIVPTELVNAALRAINGSLGSEGIDPDKLVTFRSQSYCPPVQRSSAITDLLHASPLWEVAESAIGEGAMSITFVHQHLRSPEIATRPPLPAPGP